MALSQLTSLDVREHAGRLLVAVPIGSTEQHGPHLPLGTDVVIAAALADRLAETVPGVVAAPPVCYGSSGEHAGFSGTLSIGQDVLESLLVELVRSADWAAGVVFVNGHGGNAEPVARATDRLIGEGRRVLNWWPPPPAEGDLHAGLMETSLMLVLEPDSVRMERAERGVVAPLRDLMDALRARGVAGVSPNGVLGDPAGANVHAGRAFLERAVADLVASVQAWHQR